MIDKPGTTRPKLHRHPITLSTVTSILAICGVILPIVGVIASPWVVDFMSSAMADEISEEVGKQVAPVNAGLKVLIESTVAEIEDDISALEYRRENMPETFSAADAQILTNKRRRLASQQRALAAIVEAERSRDND